MSRCVLKILYWDNYKSVRVLFDRFLFLFGAKCQVSSVMMPASLLLQLTLFTRLKFKNRLDIIYRTHLHQNSFQTTALTWILSLGKKLSLQLRKNRTACLGKSHPDILTIRMGKRTSRCALDEKDEKDYLPCGWRERTSRCALDGKDY